MRYSWATFDLQRTSDS